MAKIFVSVANYRDFETLNTVREMISTCSPENELRVVVLSQLAKEDQPLFTPLTETREVLHMMCDARDSRGACWARATIQGQLRSEDYYLQIDSHMACWERDWDKIMIGDLRRAESVCDKAIITSYPAGYTIDTSGSRVVAIRKPTVFEHFKIDGFPVVIGGYSDADPTAPLREEFYVAGGFQFARAHLPRDVPYDPELFFIGEEITLAARAYSAGYRMFAPSRYTMAHLYNHGQNKGKRSIYWDEDQDRRRELRWWQRDTMARWKATHVCHGEWFGRYGIKSVKLYDEYRARLSERYPGVDLKSITPKPEIRIHVVPPQPRDDQTKRPDTDQTSGPASDLARRPGTDQTKRPRVRVKALRG